MRKLDIFNVKVRLFHEVRHGENLSPLLFSLFLNDLGEFLQLHNLQGISLRDENAENSHNIFKTFIVMCSPNFL